MSAILYNLYACIIVAYAIDIIYISMCTEYLLWYLEIFFLDFCLLLMIQQSTLFLELPTQELLLHVVLLLEHVQPRLNCRVIRSQWQSMLVGKHGSSHARHVWKFTKIQGWIILKQDVWNLEYPCFWKIPSLSVNSTALRVITMISFRCKYMYKESRILKTIFG